MTFLETDRYRSYGFYDAKVIAKHTHILMVLQAFVLEYNRIVYVISSEFALFRG